MPGALLVAALLCGGVASAQTLSLSQLDWLVDSGSRSNSDWGSVDVTYTGSSSILYFNLSVNGSWQVQNVPVLSYRGAGVSQTETFDFVIGQDGVNVSAADIGFSLTTAPVGAAPVTTNFGVGVADRQIAMSSAEGGIPIAYSAATSLIGAAAPVLNSAAAGPGYPNQDCGLNECVPASVSNSLQYLNNRFNLGLAPGQISINQMKVATGWNAGGAPLGWWNTKAAYMQANNIPVATQATTDIASVIDSLRNGADVELGGGGHRASVVGITDLGGGRYSINVAHDTQQGVAGGTKVETVIYNSNTGNMTGAAGFNNVTFRNFVVETATVPEPSSLVLLGAVGSGVLGVLGVRRRRTAVIA
jgi:hypothetical protein